MKYVCLFTLSISTGVAFHIDTITRRCCSLERLPVVTKDRTVRSRHFKTVGSRRSPLIVMDDRVISPTRLLVKLSSLNNDDDDDGEINMNHDITAKVDKAKEEMLYSYRAIGQSYIAASLLLLRRIGTTMTSFHVISGPLMASVLSYILKDATKYDRLAGSTYKRMNILLLTFGFTGVIQTIVDLLFIGVMSKGRLLWMFWMTLYVFTCSICLRGYAYSVVNNDGGRGEGNTILQDIIDDLKSQFKSLRSSIYMARKKLPSNLQSTLYLIASLTHTLVSSAMLLLLLPNLARPYYIITWGKQLLTTGVCFVLKDASDRGRLEGPTFIKLNFLSSFVFCTMSANYSQVHTSKIASILAGANSIFAFMAAFFGCLGLLFKRRKIQYFDETLSRNNAARLSDYYPLEE